MHLSNGTRWLLRIGTGITLAFIYIPLIVIAIYAFNESRSQSWPIDGLTLEWFSKAFDNQGVRDALMTSLKAGLGATAIALVLGTCAALAVARYRFFGREAISFLVILPIALPGIVTGMALNATFTQVLGVDLTLFTVIVGHATFCIVVVYNNALARLRRTGTSLEEASQDLGADGWQTFRNITLPSMRSALVAGALLAFALSFDEIIVTTFTAGGDQTLPIWIFSNYSRPNQLPVVNVVGLMLILLSIIPVYLANKLTQDPAGTAGGAPAAAAVGALGHPAGGPTAASPDSTRPRAACGPAARRITSSYSFSRAASRVGLEIAGASRRVTPAEAVDRLPPVERPAGGAGLPDGAREVVAPSSTSCARRRAGHRACRPRFRVRSLPSTTAVSSPSRTSKRSSWSGWK